MKIKSENLPNNSKKSTFQLISEFIFLWRVACYSNLRVGLKKYIFRLLIYILYILSNITHVTWASDIILLCTTMPSKILLITVKWTGLCLLFFKLEKSLNKSLAKCLVSCVNLHSFTLAENHANIFWYRLWYRICVYIIASVAVCIDRWTWVAWWHQEAYEV